VAGIDPAHLSRVERGLSNPSLSTLSRLAEALGLQDLLQELQDLHECEAVSGASNQFGSILVRSYVTKGLPNRRPQESLASSEGGFGTNKQPHEQPTDAESKPTWGKPKAYGWSAPGTQWHDVTDALGKTQTDAKSAEDREADRRLVHLSVEHAPIFLFVLDAKGSLIVTAGAAARAYVDESGDIVGRPLAEWTKDAPQARAAVTKALSGEAAEWEGVVGKRCYETHLVPVLDPDGGLVVVAGVAFDRTAQHEIEFAREARLERIVEGTIQALGHVLEEREPYLVGHQRRTEQLAVAIASEMGWETPHIETVRVSARLHDIGRLTCPADVLNRPGPLTAEEVPLIEAHSTAGAAMLADMEYDDVIVSAVRQHHERLDGSGYPDGLSGADILPEAKVIAVADVLEAMTSPRPHRPAYEVRDALAEVHAARGRLFDEDAVDACERVLARE
jgi:putative nucleotidyltransferase with HDIG domain